MPARKIILLLIALLIAAGTVVLARSMMQNPQTGTIAVTQQNAGMEEVLVATRDLPIGTLIKETDVKWHPWGSNAINDKLIVKNKSGDTPYIGAVVRQSLRAGEPLFTSNIVRTREEGFMAAVLTPGMRAVSVPITPAGGVAGFIFPGDRIDVIVTHQVTRKTDAEPHGHKVSETVLTNVRVLALDQRSNDQITEPKIAQIATLEVTPKQAETLVLANQIGTLSLVLRSLAIGSHEPPGLESASGQAQSDTIISPSADDITWDSDISRVLTSPGNRNGTVQRIEVMRGKDKTESVFELRQ